MFNLKSLFKDPAQLVSVDSLKKSMDVSEYGVVLDVRNLDEYNGGHIQNSIHIPANEVELKIASLIPLKTTRVFCVDMDGETAYKVAKKLKGMGYQLSYAIDGGLKAWTGKNLPLVK